jgi:hypothetical protein
MISKKHQTAQPQSPTLLLNYYLLNAILLDVPSRAITVAMRHSNRDGFLGKNGVKEVFLGIRMPSLLNRQSRAHLKAMMRSHEKGHHPQQQKGA